MKRVLLSNRIPQFHGSHKPPFEICPWGRGHSFEPEAIAEDRITFKAFCILSYNFWIKVRQTAKNTVFIRVQPGLELEDKLELQQAETLMGEWLGPQTLLITTHLP